MTTQLSHQNVAILGGGISGLVSAYRLLQQGVGATIFEASNALGGLGGTFEYKGAVMEQFYHVMLNSDGPLLALLEELDLASSIHWKETGMGFQYEEAFYPFNTPMDLLRFGALTVPERIRTAVGAAYITKFVKDGAALDGITAAEWLTKIFGASVFRKLWLPLLTSKFGDRYPTVPAYWFWSRLTREKGGAKEVKGYVEGGYRAIADAIAEKITAMGGKILLNTPVEGLQETATGVRVNTKGACLEFSSAVSTLPMPLLQRIARGELATAVPHANLTYQGVVNVVLILKERLQPYYWNAIVKEGFPFQGLVETTQVVPLEQTNGRHLVYLMNYCHKDSNEFHRGDHDWEFQAKKALQAMYPDFDQSLVEEIKVFRAPYVEPVWPVNYLSARPACRIGQGNVYLATTAQAYPRVNAWNTMVEIASETVTAILQDLASRPATVPAAGELVNA
jgi:protoporphyrinogen oxidase